LSQLAALCRRANQKHNFAHPVPDHEGRFAIVTNVGRGERWTRRRNRRLRSSRTAKSWRPDISTLVSTRDNASHCAGMVARKPDHQGDHEGNRKTTAQGMPGEYPANL
jgi:hypothetical protein